MLGLHDDGRRAITGKHHRPVEYADFISTKYRMKSLAFLVLF